jgi:hypothetical protein
MSQINSEIDALRIRLAELEKKKEQEKEQELEKKTFPLKILEKIVEEKRKQIQRGSYKSAPLERFNDQDKLAFLEPIFYMLQNIQERLDVLEKK